ncbi:MAG TPA: TlpA disulfide reductase family protein [Usitatibacter sp.]|nr:TlpA disulfide reductase family protein [Usitatibacter sp.]
MRRLFALLLIALAPAVHALDAGNPVPSVSAPRLGQSGPPVSLATLKGQVVYVDFWASWCVPCRLSMPTLDALYRKHAGRGFTVVGFNKDVEPEDAQRFLQRVPVSFPLAQDLKDAAARAFDVKAMPSGYLVDRRGVVRKIHRGFTSETAAALEHEIEELLKDPA